MTQAPADFRRATMVVKDIEPILALYHDILGMSVYCDQEIVVSGKGLPAGDTDSKTGLPILHGNDGYVGMLGILPHVERPLPEPGTASGPQPGSNWRGCAGAETRPQADGDVLRGPGHQLLRYTRVFRRTQPAALAPLAENCALGVNSVGIAKTSAVHLAALLPAQDAIPVLAVGLIQRRFPVRQAHFDSLGQNGPH